MPLPDTLEQELRSIDPSLKWMDLGANVARTIPNGLYVIGVLDWGELTHRQVLEKMILWARNAGANAYILGHNHNTNNAIIYVIRA